jgi:hypothetical protein
LFGFTKIHVRRDIEFLRIFVYYLTLYLWEGAMNRFLTIALIGGLLLAIPHGSYARQWKPTKTSLAQEYLKIEHQRSENEIVLVMWLAPSFIENIPGNEAAREALSEYAMIVLTHAQISTLGQWSFTEPKDVVIETGDNDIRQPIPEGRLPPLVSAMSGMLSKILSQGLGPLVVSG